MSELEQTLIDLAAEVEWPPTPRVELQLVGRRHPRRRTRLVVVLALVVIAIAVAFAVPQARSALLRFFHLGGVTIQRVETLPNAGERSLTAGLGRPVSKVEAAGALLAPVRLPPVRGRVQLYELGDVVSSVLSVPEPVLVSELRLGTGTLLPTKLLGPQTKIERTRVFVAGDAAWLSGAKHVFIVPPTPPRLAGNVLLWVHDGITFRLEGRMLDKETALRLAREISR